MNYYGFCLKYYAMILGLTLAVVSLSGQASDKSDLDSVSAIKLIKTISGDHRSFESKLRDHYRHPLDTLMWFGLRKEMTVVELFPGNGWYAEILSPYVREKGLYYAAGFDANSLARFKQKLDADPALYDKTVVTELSLPMTLVVAPPNSVDRVLTFRDVHNWIKGGYADELFTAMFEALKPGGIMGLVEHRQNFQIVQDLKVKSGYVNEDYVIALALKAGFEFVDRSEINANPSDTKDYEGGVWALPPTLQHNNKDRDRYLAIGESDRMTLKFKKPQNAKETSMPTAEDIVANCDHKYIGSDQRALLTITNSNKDGKQKKNVYLRLVKNYEGRDDLLEKMVLFARFPPESKGLAFMRWEYTPESKKVVDQWLYTPSLRNMRRVSVRDEGERFLGSTLTLADIGARAVNRDTHRLLRIDRNGNMMFYVIESIPVSKNDIYSKRLMWFSKTPSWENCLKAGVVYFDKKGFHLKNQKLRWQKVQDVWIWKRVEVKNLQTKERSIFEIHDIEIDVGLDDRLFTERALRKGIK